MYMTYRQLKALMRIQ
uniref:Uncharacterized protein n=1 Tax=Anguilla anguilla TaxID=7936 RepID=A0A0E9QND3_ANGAN